jgi:hypothetical protein
MIRQHRTTAAVVLSLALTTSLAPTASADPAPLARAEAAIAATQSSPPVRPNPDEQSANAAATYSGPCSEVCSGGAGSYGSPSQLVVTPSAVRIVAHSSGFHWRDAGIGAAASLLLFGIGLAGIRTATNSRRRHTRDPHAIATG